MKKFDELIKKLGPKAQEFEPLAKHTVLKVGGPARIFFQADSADELTSAVQAAIKVQIPYLVLGMGANVLVSDSGFNGLVIKNKTSQLNIVGKKGKFEKGERRDELVLVKAESGVTLVQLCRFSFEESLSGLEFLYAIPGTVGGAVKINAHGKPAENEFLGNLLKEATLLTPDGEVKKVGRNYLDFSYDYSKLSETSEIVVDVVFELKYGNKEKIWQKALEYFNARKSAQPYDIPSAGCFFQNIKVSDATRLGLTNGIYSTGMLIAQTGLRGTQIGGAKISEKHCNFFTNVGNAKAADFIELIKLVKDKVKEKFGVELKEEIFLVGFN